MTCPTCYGITAVVDSRQKGKTIRRRRECLDCGTRFSSEEVMVGTPALIKQSVSKKATHSLDYEYDDGWNLHQVATSGISAEEEYFKSLEDV